MDDSPPYAAALRRALKTREVPFTADENISECSHCKGNNWKVQMECFLFECYKELYRSPSRARFAENVLLRALEIRPDLHICVPWIRFEGTDDWHVELTWTVHSRGTIVVETHGKSDVTVSLYGRSGFTGTRPALPISRKWITCTDPGDVDSVALAAHEVYPRLRRPDSLARFLIKRSVAIGSIFAALFTGIVLFLEMATQMQQDDANVLHAATVIVVLLVILFVYLAGKANPRPGPPSDDADSCRKYEQTKRADDAC